MKGKIRGLSSSSNDFERDTYKGGRGALAPRPPLQVSLSEFFELLLKYRIFSLTADLIFQFFVGEAWGERRIIFWKFKEHQNYDLCLF